MSSKLIVLLGLLALLLSSEVASAGLPEKYCPPNDGGGSGGPFSPDDGGGFGSRCGVRFGGGFRPPYVGYLPPNGGN